MIGGELFNLICPFMFEKVGPTSCPEWISALPPPWLHCLVLAFPICLPASVLDGIPQWMSFLPLAPPCHSDHTKKKTMQSRLWIGIIMGITRSEQFLLHKVTGRMSWALSSVSCCALQTLGLAQCSGRKWVLVESHPLGDQQVSDPGNYHAGLNFCMMKIGFFVRQSNVISSFKLFSQNIC